MKISESASKVILSIMEKNNLDPKSYYLKFEIMTNGALGFTFTSESEKCEYHHGLGVCVDASVSMKDTFVDYGEVNGRKGIIFMENKNGNNNDTKGS